MLAKPPLLIQEGIPAPTDWLTTFCQPIWFSLANAPEIFADHPQVSLLVIRANFSLSPSLLQKLPKLTAIGLVSTGTDNLPLAYLVQRGIKYYTAAGANAKAVQEYCIQALAHWALEHPEEVKQGVGIIGKGRIGSLLLAFLERVAIPVSWYDPFLKGSQPLAKVLQHPILSWHVPLSYEGPWPTAGSIRHDLFANHRIINTSRGGIWHLPSLEYFASQGNIWAQDVYPLEPPPHIPKARFSTPHIAGYSTLGRLNGLEKVLQAMFAKVPPLPKPNSTPWYLAEESILFTANPQSFTSRRNSFPWRKEFAEYTREEQQEFKEKFSGLPPSWFSAIWPNEHG